MKRLDLVQLTFIIIGIIAGFFCLRLIAPFLLYFFSWFSEGLKGGYFLEAFIQNIIMIAVYLIFSIYLIKNSKQLAEWISNKASLDSDINLSLNKTELIFALFLGLGIFGLIDELASLIPDLYTYIKENNNVDIGPYIKKPRTVMVATESIKVALFLILIIYAKTFADYFSSRINNIEPEDEINTELK